MTANFTRSVDRDDILDRLDLADLWPDLVGPRKSTTWPCPNRDHPQTGATPPVSIDREGRLWNCHGCGAGGTAIDLAKHLHDTSTGDAIRQCATWAGLSKGHELTSAPRTTRRTTSMQTNDRPRPHPEDENAAPTPDDADARLDAYVKARRWRREVVDQFGLRVVLDKRDQPRVRHPFRVRGEVMWWQDRAMIPGQAPKFLAPSGRSAIPYSIDLADTLNRAEELNAATIVEGPTDLVALAHAFDLQAVIAVPGTATISADRLAAMFDGLSEVAVIADADDAGEAFRRGITTSLSDRDVPVHHVQVPNGMNDLEEWRRVRCGANDLAFAAEVLEAWGEHAEALAVRADLSLGVAA